jgi:HPt (histidine-containing phosphotransfer) domain-containing protein
MNRQSFQNPGSGEGNTPAISAEEFQALVEMVGPDAPDVLVDLLDTYLVESSGLVNAIREGASSGDLASALRPAHSLKSSSTSIGALRLSKLCADLESHLRGNLPGLDVNGQVRMIENEFVRVQSALDVEKAKLLG